MEVAVVAVPDEEEDDEGWAGAFNSTVVVATDESTVLLDDALIDSEGTADECADVALELALLSGGWRTGNAAFFQPPGFTAPPAGTKPTVLLSPPPAVVMDEAAAKLLPAAIEDDDATRFCSFCRHAGAEVEEVVLLAVGVGRSTVALDGLTLTSPPPLLPLALLLEGSPAFGGLYSPYGRPVTGSLLPSAISRCTSSLKRLSAPLPAEVKDDAPPPFPAAPLLLLPLPPGLTIAGAAACPCCCCLV